MTGREDRWPARRAFRLLHAGRVRREVDAELRFHLEGRVEELMAQGLPRDEAEAEARRRFGDPARIGAELEVIDGEMERRRRLGEWSAGLWRDVRFAWRGMAARPGYTAVVALTLALAIGANTAIYSAVRAVLLRPLPVAGLDRMVALRVDMPRLELLDGSMSAGEVVDLGARADLFEGVTGILGANVTLTGRGEPRRIAVTKTLGDFRTVFGVRPALGQFYAPGASTPGSHRVVVLSHGMWQELFGGDPAAVGQTLVLNDSAYQVVGVLPRDFAYPRTAAAWAPFALTERELSPQRRASLIMTPVARLRAGVTPAQLGERLRGELRRWQERYPQNAYGDESAYRVRVVPFVEFLAGQLRPVLLALLGAVTAVLLIACANVASLQLVRTTGRAKEIAVRGALGAGRWPIVRQVLVESLALAAVGGVAGVLLGTLALRLLSRWQGAEYDALRSLRLDPGVLALTAGVTVLAGVLFGVVPARHASRVRAQEALKDGGGRGASLGARRHRFLQGAVIVQVALTVVLLLGSGVMVRSLSRLLATDPGFRAAGVLTMQIAPPPTRYKYAERPALYERVAERVRALPGIEAAALTSTVPFSDMILDSSPFTVPGAPPLPDGQQRHANAVAVTPEYFRALGVPLLRGRPFTDADRAGAPPVVIVDERLATHYFGAENPVGRTIDHFGQGLTIVAVVRSLTQSELGAAHKATVYYPYAQMPFPWAGIVVRSALPAATAGAMVRAAVRDVDPALPVHDVQTLPARIERSLGARRLAVAVLGAFAGLALLLALLGTYGVLSYSTSQRTRELGIRIALGAQPRAVVAGVLRSGLTLTGVGLVVGVAAYVGVGGRVLAALLYGVSPRDPATLTAGVALLSVAAALACWIPARRAARVDPAVTLRAE